MIKSSLMKALHETRILFFTFEAFYITFQAISTVSANRRQSHYTDAQKPGSEDDYVSNLLAARADRFLYFQEA